MTDALTESVKYLHIAITAGGFSMVLEHLGSRYDHIFAAFALLALLCSGILYFGGLWEIRREEEEED